MPEADDHHAVLLRQDGLVHLPAVVQVREHVRHLGAGPGACEENCAHPLLPAAAGHGVKGLGPTAGGRDPAPRLDPRARPLDPRARPQPRRGEPVGAAPLGSRPRPPRPTALPAPQLRPLAPLPVRLERPALRSFRAWTRAGRCVRADVSVSVRADVSVRVPADVGGRARHWEARDTRGPGLQAARER